tara:strand:- start:158 stop:553 length:396 start_codon:yes stop_codon:yes gene_type:complete
MANDTTLMGGGGYGNPLRNTPANLRNFSPILTKPVNMGSNAVIEILANAAGKQVLIWGLNLTTDAAGAFGGILEDKDGTDLLAGVANVNGPFFLNLEIPIAVTVGKGVQFNTVAGGGTNSYATILYHVIDV